MSYKLLLPFIYLMLTFPDFAEKCSFKITGHPVDIAPQFLENIFVAQQNILMSLYTDLAPCLELAVFSTSPGVFYLGIYRSEDQEAQCGHCYYNIMSSTLCIQRSKSLYVCVYVSCCVV
jgi:hypothetical protein